MSRLVSVQVARERATDGHEWIVVNRARPADRRPGHLVTPARGAVFSPVSGAALSGPHMDAEEFPTALLAVESALVRIAAHTRLPSVQYPEYLPIARLRDRRQLHIVRRREDWAGFVPGLSALAVVSFADWPAGGGRRRWAVRPLSLRGQIGDPEWHETPAAALGAALVAMIRAAGLPGGG